MTENEEMYVTKRNGEREIVSFDKILQRIKNTGQEANIQLNYTMLAMKVIDQLYDGISTSQIDELTSEQCASLASTHPDYNTLAGRIVVSNLQKNTHSEFVKVVNDLYHFRDGHDKQCPIVSEKQYISVQKNSEKFEEMIDYERDYLIDYFGFKTLERAYLLRINKKIVERPQHMWMRVAIGIHGDDLERVKESYDAMSQKYFTHATPTLFNAGTPRPQLSSCFLIAMEDDSIQGIYNTLKDCANISKWAGGIGLHIHNIRSTGTHIRGTNGTSNGIVPMLRVFNTTAKYVDQGGGKRNGSFAIYLEPWHGDIEVFLQMRKNHGDEELKARDLFYGLWIPDLFMERVKTNSTWTLMCPDECPGLSDVYGDEFKELYERYESQGRGKKTMQARDLWFQILDAQMETGTPYLCYKDAANRKSNQKNIGIIKSSNLCVAPETPILTQQGHICIESLVGQHVDVWNGTEFSNVEIIQTGENQELVEVKTSDGRSLTCTPYHKFYIQDSYHSKKPLIVEAKDLQVNQKLVKCEYPLIDGKEPMKYSYTHGFFCGDGTYYNNQTNEEKCKFKAQEGNSFCKRHQDQNTIISTHENSDYCIGISNKKRPKISLYDAKKELVEYMDYVSKSGNNTRLDLILPIDLAEKFFVPHQASLQEKLEWFAGYSDADGAVIKNGNNCSLQIGSIEKDFLLEVQLMLQTCGIHPKVTKMRDATQHNLPNGKGGHESYMTKPLYRLLVSSWDIYFLKTLGFTTRRLIFPAILPQRSAKQFVKIVSVTPLERRDNTYCFHEPKKNAGIFNGMYTSQCTEIMEVSTSKETAVCNLASIALPSFVDTSTQPPSYNFEKLHEISKIVTNNLNKVIDVNFYPTEKTNTSNMRHRPIGIGVQGLADTFIQMGYTFESEEAKTLNKHIFETIYHGALEKSCEIATVDGPYETFYGSPAANGVLQFDMWNVEPTQERYDWVGLKEKIKNNGLANSLLMAPMPTASTSQILGYNECIEPITSNIYSRRTLAGEFIMANKYLMRDLLDLGLWNEKVKNNIIANNGSVQQIDMIPEDIRNKYKTVWEISMQSLIDMAADRGAYICQSQSLNLWMEDPNYSSMTSMHFYAWTKGLKTGIYYLRRRGRHQAQQFTIEPEKKENSGIQEDENEICEMCSS